MAMVRFASTCDTPSCGRRSEEYTAWPQCRTCHKHVCGQCAEPFTVHTIGRSDDDGREWEELTVQCGACLESGQADEFTDVESARRVGYDVESPK